MGAPGSRGGRAGPGVLPFRKKAPAVRDCSATASCPGGRKTADSILNSEVQRAADGGASEPSVGAAERAVSGAEQLQSGQVASASRAIWDSLRIDAHAATSGVPAGNGPEAQAATHSLELRALRRMLPRGQANLEEAAVPPRIPVRGSGRRGARACLHQLAENRYQTSIGTGRESAAPIHSSTPKAMDANATANTYITICRINCAQSSKLYSPRTVILSPSS